MANRKAKLTKRVVEAAEPEATRYVVSDTELSGFRLVVSPSGSKTFALRYRVGGGRGATIREPKLGDFGPLTVEQARALARDWLAEVAKGGDPSSKRQEARKAPRMDELFDRFLSDHARPNKKPSSVAEDEQLIRDYLRPSFGGRKVAEVTRAEVDRFHKGLAEKPYRGNRSLALLSKALNLAEVWGWRSDGSNPCRHVKKYRETERKRFLSPAELARLGDALRRAEAGELGAILPQAIAAVRLLIFTGCRKSEVLGMRWEWIDFEGRRVNFPDSKTGFKAVPLSAPALAVLNTLPRSEGNPFVIPGGKAGAALVNLKDPWGTIREAAELPDVRVHDLRHSFAAVGAGSGLSLHMIGGLLGQSQPQTTKRYAHLADDPLRAASDVIAGKIATAMEMTPSAEVMPLRR